jgi:hypothetical protein|tara:strand:- start:80 stop:310 length:231 start_codon:yes stop_codon:yes gene_type:complete
MWRVVKQLYPSPTSSVDRHGETFTDPWWASRNTYVAKLSGSSDQVWEYTTEAAATSKMNELSGSDSSGRKYKVILV